MNFRHMYLINSFCMKTTDFCILACKLDPF